MKIVFMGTPQFAVPTLDTLLEAGYDVVGVITSTDKMGGRGRKQVIQSDVKKYAVAQGLNILQPPNLKDLAFVEELRALQADLQIVVAFRMLPVVVWDMPRLGTYNLHGSLLPAYRGAAPINWAIMRGEEFTGVTTFKLKHEIDTGSIAYQVKVPIYKTDTVAEVHDRMMETGAAVMLQTVRAIESGSIELHEQDETKVSKAPKIFHNDCQIDLNSSPYEVYNYIRGLSPYPTAWTTFGDKKLKLYKVRYTDELHGHELGTYVTDGKKYLHLIVKNGYIDLLEIQLEGRKRMDVRSFLNGIKPEEYNSPFLQLKK